MWNATLFNSSSILGDYDGVTLFLPRSIRGNEKQSIPEHLIFCPPCRAASSWSIGWLDREKIQISATFPSMSFWLLQRGRTWPPSVGCCITCERPNIMSERGNAQFSHLLQVLNYLRGFTQTAEGQMPSSTAPKQRTNPGHLRTILLKIRPILSVPTVSRDCIHPLAAAYTVSYVVGFVHRFKSFSWNCRDSFFLSSQYSSVLVLSPPQSQLH